MFSVVILYSVQVHSGTLKSQTENSNGASWIITQSLPKQELHKLTLVELLKLCSNNAVHHCYSSSRSFERRVRSHPDRTTITPRSQERGVIHTPATAISSPVTTPMLKPKPHSTPIQKDLFTSNSSTHFAQ